MVLVGIALVPRGRRECEARFAWMVTVFFCRGPWLYHARVLKAGAP